MIKLQILGMPYNGISHNYKNLILYIIMKEVIKYG